MPVLKTELLLACCCRL